MDDKSKAIIDSSTSEQKLATMRSGSTKESAYAASALFKSGEINKTGMDIKEKEKWAKYAINSGYSADEITNSQPELAHLRKDEIKEAGNSLVGKQAATLKRTDGTAYTYSIDDLTNENSFGYEELQKEAKSKVARKLAATVDKKFVTESADQDLLTMMDERDEKNDLTFRAAAATEEAAKRKILHTKQSAINPGKTINDIEVQQLLSGSDNYGLSARRLYSEKDFRFSKQYRDDARKANPTFNEDQITQQVAKERAGKLNGDQLAELPDDVKKLVIPHVSDTKVIERALVKATSDGKKAIADAILSDVDKITPERLKLAQFNKGNIGDSVNRISSDPAIKAKLRAKFKLNPVKVPAISDAVAMAEIQRIEDAKELDLKARAIIPPPRIAVTANTLNDTKKRLRLKDFMAKQTPEFKTMMEDMDKLDPKEREIFEELMRATRKIK